MRALPFTAVLLLGLTTGGTSAQTAARLGEGGPPTTILTPGRETRTMGQGAPATRVPVSTPAASAPSAGGERAPGARPEQGTAQRPTPDQSR